jgi:quinol monooxygenase YgiN/mannose-6-phosphate isomerase-like protein (cupin superfamily)
LAGFSKIVASKVRTVDPVSAFGRFVTFRARPGDGDKLAEVLLRSASLVADAPGCELWLVHREQADPDAVHVNEVWASREQSQAALALEGVSENVARVLALLATAPEAVDCEALGGARVVRGTIGATRFSIPRAPDLSRDRQLLSRYDLAEVAEARYVREELGAMQVGLTHYRLPPRTSQGWAHRHSVAEEIYVALSGSGWITVDEQPFELRRLDAVRVAPASVRELGAGEDGLEVLAFGSHSPGDGEMVAHK